MKIVASRAALLVALAAGGAGCSNTGHMSDEKAAPRAGAESGSMASRDNAPASAPAESRSPAAPVGETRPESAAGISYQVPADWPSTEAASSMRAAQYAIPSTGGGEAGELALFFFGAGQGGDVNANIERWIAQMEPSEGKAAAEAKRERHRVGDVTISTVRLDGNYSGPMMPGMGGGVEKPGYRMWAAVVEGEGGPWFFKAVGPEKTIEDAEASLDALVDSVKPAP